MTDIIAAAAQIIFLLLLLVIGSKDLKKAHKLLSLFDNGGWKDCPFYLERMEGGRRKTDAELLN